MLWDLAEGKRLYSLDAGDVIHSLTFSPNRYWLCAATQSSIKIWDLESKSQVRRSKRRRGGLLVPLTAAGVSFVRDTRSTLRRLYFTRRPCA